MLFTYLILYSTEEKKNDLLKILNELKWGLILFVRHNFLITRKHYVLFSTFAAFECYTDPGLTNSVQFC